LSAAARYSYSPAASTAREELLVVGHGFSRRMLAGLGRCGLAAAEGEVVKTGEKVIVVVRIRLTAAGRRALKAMLPEM
jgi:hypothetical protein